MHHIYHTEGFVLGSKNYKEADKYYYIFTPDFGLIYASAQGVRKISSKLRFVLQDFAYIKIDLVQGRDFWRITNVSKTSQLENLTKPNIFNIVVNISRLLKRLLAGEEANKKLFDDLINGLRVLEHSVSKEDRESIETVLVLRILNNLGYMGDTGNFTDFVASPFEEDLVFKASKNRIRILKEINKALKETHL